MASYHECTQSSCVHRPVSLIMIFSKFGTRSCAMGILRVFFTSKMNCWYLNCPILVCQTVFWKKNARIVHARARCVLLGCLINQTIIFYCVQLYSGGRGGDRDSWVRGHTFRDTTENRMCSNININNFEQFLYPLPMHLTLICDSSIKERNFNDIKCTKGTNYHFHL